MNKLLTLIIAVSLVMTLCVTASAASGGTITVENAKVGEDYELYRILDLSTDSTGTKFTYTIPANGEWDGFYAQETVKAILNINSENDVVTWKNGVDESTGAETLAKLALSYIQQNATVNATDTKTAEATTVAFTGLKYGYYLLNTSIGSICALDSNHQAVVINDKHGAPAVEKLVGLDGTTQFDAINTAEIGDTINFKSTLTNINDVNNLVFTDTMDDGLTFNVASLVVTCNGSVIPAGDTTYSLVTNPTTPQTFSVKFVNGHHDLSATESIVITYTATVNSSAVIGGTGNINEAKLTYGKNQESTSDTTTTYVYGFSIKKINAEEAPLTGAKFVIGRGDADKEYAVIVNGLLADWTTNKAEATLTSPANGLIVVEGLDAGTYFIEENEAPAGYNKLATAITVVIGEDGSVTADNQPHADKIVEIVNATGPELPITGGIGTTIFIVVGLIGVMVLGVFLITNKRMKKEGF